METKAQKTARKAALDRSVEFRQVKKPKTLASNRKDRQQASKQPNTVLYQSNRVPVPRSAFDDYADDHKAQMIAAGVVSGSVLLMIGLFIGWFAR